MKSTIVFAFFVVGASAPGQSITLAEALLSAKINRLNVSAAADAVSSARASRSATAVGPPLVLGTGATSREGLGATDQDLFLSYTPDVFGRASAARKRLDAVVSKLLAEQKRTLLEVQSEVLAAYIEAHASGQQRAAATGLADVAEAVFQATQRRFEEGKVPEVQLSLARIERDRAYQTVAQLKSKEHAALRRLAGAMGASQAPTSVVAPDLLEPEVRIERHPDLMALAADAAAAIAEAVEAAKENAPELEWTALRSPWSEPNSHFALRAQLTWRIGDFGRTRFSVNAARLRARSYEAQSDDLVRRVHAELAANALETESAKERLESARAIRRAAAELSTKSQRGFAEGIGTLLDVLEATRALRDLEREVVEIEREFLLAVASRYMASGTLIEVKS